MSSSTALEYGFPSTHSTNAVSVAVYGLLLLRDATSIHPTTKTILQIVCYFYATSIIIGRLYCGMHGFLDVIVGSALGAVLSLAQVLFVERIDTFVHENSFKAIFLIISVVLVLIRIHPEPADDCPCFDDSIAFAGVFCGVEFAKWHFAQSPYSWNQPVSGTTPFDLNALGWTKTVARVGVGVICVFAWREVMKPALLTALPPVFRVVEHRGWSLPRRFFMPATQYDQVPKHTKTDNVMPSVLEIPSFLSKMRHARSRSISQGPLSAADAYETLAFRKKLRRESQSGTESSRIGPDSQGLRARAKSDSLRQNGFTKSSEKTDSFIMERIPQSPLSPPASSGMESGSSEGSGAATLQVTGQGEKGHPGLTRSPSQLRREDEKDEREVFAGLKKPRVRYDVEVVTKLIVYGGIAWLSVEGCPLLFHLIGLGVYGLRP